MHARRRGRRALTVGLGLALFGALLAGLPGASARDVGIDRALVFGRWSLEAEAVVDGDTLKVPEAPSVRVMCVDTEEIFKSARDRVAAAADFHAYAQAKRGDAPRPVKYGTPLGEAAKRFAAALVAQSTAVRLERDSVGGRELDIYGRRLAHVILEGPEGDVNLALALVRAGFSPYFVKYGRSLRFDASLRAAEADAKWRRIGVWGSDGPPHYPDYDERLAWWHERADQVDRWREAAAPDGVLLGTVRTGSALAARVGEETRVFGVLDRIIETRDGTKRIVFLGDQARRGFPLVVFDLSILEAWDMPRLESMYVTARGKITLYRGRPQIVIERAEQVSTD